MNSSFRTYRVWLGLIALSFLPRGSGADFSRESAWASVQAEFPAARRVDAGLDERGRIEVYKRTSTHSLAVEIGVPATTPVRATVYMLHGGGWESGTPAMERPLAAALRRKGFATVLVAYRLGPDGRFPHSLEDVKDAMAWCESHREAIGLTDAPCWVLGCSAGAQMASWLGAVSGLSQVEGLESFRPARIAAVVNIDGLMDFTDPELLQQQRSRPSAPTRFLGGSMAERSEVWRLASPLLQLHPQSAPMLFLRSTAHTPLLPGRDEAVRKLSAWGVPVREKVFNGSPHTFWLFAPWFSLVVEEIDAFASQLSRP